MRTDEVIEMFESLNAAAVDYYERNGFVVIRQMLSEQLIQRMLERVDGMLEGRCDPVGVTHLGAGSDQSNNDPGRLNKQIIVREFPALDDVFRSFVDDGSMVGAACRLVESDEITCFQMQAMVKEPGCTNPTPWHQDNTYWRFDDDSVRGVTAWAPLTSTRADDGTMWLLPGSHRGELLHHGAAGGVSKYQAIQETIDEEKLLPLELAPGDVSFHHMNTIHGAYPNGGHNRRVAIATHFHNRTEQPQLASP